MQIRNLLSSVFLMFLGTIFLLTLTNCKKNSIEIQQPAPIAVTDIDGNGYHAVTIGTQVWLVENLKVTKYLNGDPVPNITSNTAWNNTNGACCWYHNDIANKTDFGALYNWYTLVDSRNLAPVGWHIPSDAEWATLTAILGGISVAGGKMKETGTTHWSSPNSGATNSSGFTALPAGARDIDGLFDFLGGYTYFWSSTQDDSATAWSRYLLPYNGNIIRGHFDKSYGFSVRCIKD